jgi:hypothetical protein
MTRVAANRKMTLTDAEIKNIKSVVREEFDTRLSADRRYGEAMRGYIAAGNKRAYIDRASSEGKKLLPSIVARHTNAELDKRATAKPAAKATTNGAKPAVNGNGARADATGAVWLAGSPASQGLQVDYNRTTQGMLLRNEAYVQGKKELHKWKQRVV